MEYISSRTAGGVWDCERLMWTCVCSKRELVEGVGSVAIMSHRHYLARVVANLVRWHVYAQHDVVDPNEYSDRKVGARWEGEGVGQVELPTGKLFSGDVRGMSGRWDVEGGDEGGGVCVGGGGAGEAKNRWGGT